MSASAVSDIARMFGSLVDRGLAWFVSQVYSLIFAIVDVNLFGSVIESFKDRIFVFIAVFMLFKLSLSVIKFIASPDEIAGSGGAKLVQRVIIVLALLGSINWIFDMSRRLESAILTENVIQKVLMGDDYSGDNIATEDSIAPNKIGDYMAYYFLMSFVDFNRNDKTIISAGSKCNNIFLAPNDYCTVPKAKSGTMGWDKIEDTINTARDKFDYGTAFSAEIINAKVNGKYVFNYNMGISTLCLFAGGIILAIFVIDIAVRTIKLGFLELIAPIPIISYIDPNSQKDMFGKWVSTCIKTYVDLFIRLAALFFVIGIIQNLSYTKMIIQGIGLTGIHPLLLPAIFLGLLVFLIRAPKLLEEITGFKLEGGTLKDLKLGATKVTNAVTSLTSMPVAFAGGMTANGVAKGISLAKKIDSGEINPHSFKEMSGAVMGYAGSMFAGGLAAFGRTAYANFKSGGQNAFKNASGAVKIGSVNRNLRDKGYGIKDKFTDKWTDMAQIKNDYGTTGRLSKEVKAANFKMTDARQQEANVAQQMNLLPSSDKFKDKDRGAVLDAMSYRIDQSTGELKKTFSSYSDYLSTQLLKHKNDINLNDDEINMLINASKGNDPNFSAQDAIDGMYTYLRQSSANRDTLDSTQFNEISGMLDRYIAADSATKAAEKEYNRISQDFQEVQKAGGKK